MTGAEGAVSASPRQPLREIDGDALLAGLRSSLAWLQANQEQVNELNVFPVPDGDTGSNMYLTLRSAVEDAQAAPVPSSAGSVMRAAAHGSLMGARGNSGVILSQIFRGFAQGVGGSGPAGRGRRRRLPQRGGPGRLQGGDEADRGDHPHRGARGRRGRPARRGHQLRHPRRARRDGARGAQRRRADHRPAGRAARGRGGRRGRVRPGGDLRGADPGGRRVGRGGPAAPPGARAPQWRAPGATAGRSRGDAPGGCGGPGHHRVTGCRSSAGRAGGGVRPRSRAGSRAGATAPSS